VIAKYRFGNLGALIALITEGNCDQGFSDRSAAFRPKPVRKGMARIAESKCPSQRTD
jgi:hypothetical protein